MSQRVSSSRDWRRTEEASPSAKYTSLVLLGMLVIALTIVLVIWLWPRRGMTAGLWVLDVPSRDLGLADIPSRGLIDTQRLPATTPSDAEAFSTASVIDQLPESLEELLGAEKKLDTAIVLMTTYGVSRVTAEDEATGLLLSGNFKFSENSRMATPAELVAQAEKIKADQKLLLLDTSYLTSDVWFGMGVNEFPLLLEQAVAESNDENLWVIHATGMLQPAQVIYQEDESETLFSRAVRFALEQSGDTTLGTKGEKISLLHFYQKLIQFYDGYDAGMTPVVMQGGKGLLDLAGEEDLRDKLEKTFLFERRISPPEEEEDDKKSDDSEKSSEKKRDKSTSLSSPQQQNLLAISRALGEALATPLLNLPNSSAPNGTVGLLSRSIRWTSLASILSHNALASLQDDSSADTKQDEQKQDGSADANQAATDENKTDEPAATDDATTAASAPDGPSLQDRIAKLESTLADDGWKWNDLNRELIELHRVVQELQRRQNPGGWSPVDFAPEAWHGVLMEVSQLDERAIHVRPTAVQFDNRVNDARQLRESLEQLQRELQGERIANRLTNPGEVVDEVWKGWDQLGRLNQGGLRGSWEDADPRKRDVTRSLRAYHDALFRAKYYVRLHDELSAIGIADLFGDISELLKRLKENQDQFAMSVFGTPDNGFTRELQELRRARTQLNDIEEQLFEQLNSIVARLDSRETDEDQLIDGLQGQRICVIVLQSPLLPLFEREGVRPGDEEATFSRARMLEEFHRLQQSKTPTIVGDASGVALPVARDFFGDAGAWERAINRLKLHHGLLQLVADDQAGFTEVRDQINAIRLPRQFDRDQIKQMLSEFRVATESLHKLYEQVVVNKRFEGILDEKGQLQSRVAASLLDARDRVQLFRVDQGLPQLVFHDQRAPEVIRFAGNGEFRFQIDNNPQFDFDKGELTFELPLTVKGYEDELLDIDVIGFNGGAFQLSHQGKVIGPGEKLQVAVSSDETSVVRLIAKPLVDAANLPERYSASSPLLQLEAQDSAGVAVSTARVYISPPLPKFVDLIVRSRDTRAWEPSSDSGEMSPANGRPEGFSAADRIFPDAQGIEVTRVKIFPAMMATKPGEAPVPRMTTFDMHLVNRSGYEVEADVEVFKVTLPRGEKEGRTGMPVALLPGRIAPGLGGTPHQAIIDKFLKPLEDRSSRPINSLFAKQGIKLPAAPQAWPTRDQTFGTGAEGASTGIAVPFDFSPAPAEDGSAPPPAAEGETAAEPLPHGLLCRITTKGWGDKPQVDYRWIELEVADADEYLQVAKRDSDQGQRVVYQPRSRTLEFEAQPKLDPKWKLNDYPWEFLKKVQVRWYLPDDTERYPRDAIPPLAVLEPNKRATTSWRIPQVQYTSDMLSPLYLDVDGYPRALAYKIDISQVPFDSRDSFPAKYARDESQEVRIHRISGLLDGKVQWTSNQLSENVFWLGYCDDLLIEYQIDGPMESMRTLIPANLPDQEEFVELEIIGPTGVIKLDQEYFDRRIEFQGQLDPKGNLQISTMVSDLSQTLQANEFAWNEPIRVEARLLSSRNDPGRDFAAFGIDSEKPQIREVQTLLVKSDGTARPLGSGEAVGLEDTISLVVIARDEHSGMDPENVEFFINPRFVNGEWLFAEATKLGTTNPAFEMEQGTWGRYSMNVTSKAFGGGIGEFRIVPRVSDRVGNQFDIRDGERDAFVVRFENKQSVAMEEEKEELPSSYEIRLQLTVYETPIPSDPQSIKVNDSDVPIAKAGDRYVLKDLKPGQYKIEVSYLTQTKRERKGTVTVKIAPDEKRPVISRNLELK